MADNWNKTGQGSATATQEKSGAASVVEKVKDTAADVWHKTEDLACEAAGKVKQAAKGVGHMAENAYEATTEKVKQAAKGAGRMAENAYEATTEKAGEVFNSLERTMRRNPLPAVCIGFGLGFLIGNLLSRR